MQDKCPVCQSPAGKKIAESWVFRFDCLRCGGFRIHSQLHIVLYALSSCRQLSDEQIANISGHFRENQNQLWTREDLERLERLRSPSAREKATKLMRFIRQQFPSGGEQFQIFYNDAEYVLDFIELHRSV